jgi:hypothetical protein
LPAEDGPARVGIYRGEIVHQGTAYPGKPHEDALRSFAKKLMQTKPFKLVAVALANKMARIAFAIMRGRTTYSAAPV